MNFIFFALLISAYSTAAFAQQQRGGSVSGISDRIENCYEQNKIVESAMSSNFSGILALESGRNFLRCQAAKEGVLKKKVQISSAEIISRIGNVLDRKLETVADVFSKYIE